METDNVAVHTFEGSDGRRVVALFAVLVLLIGGFFTTRLIREFAGGGMASMPGMAASTSSPRALDTDAFAARIAESEAFVVNVQPGGDRIPGTDAWVGSGRQFD